MLSDKKVVCPHNLLEKAGGNKGVKAAIVNAGKPLPMLAVLDAVNEKLIEPVFIGDKIERPTSHAERAAFIIVQSSKKFVAPNLADKISKKIIFEIY